MFIACDIALFGTFWFIRDGKGEFSFFDKGIQYLFMEIVTIFEVKKQLYRITASWLYTKLEHFFSLHGSMHGGMVAWSVKAV